jgi:beta-lactamase class A
MKKNQAPGQPQAGPSYSIPDYGHDRTIYSLGRGSNPKRRRRSRRPGLMRMLGGLLILILLLVASWQLWPLVFGPAGETTTSASTSAEPTSIVTTTGKPVETTATTGQPTPTATTAATLSSAERAARLAQAAVEITGLLESASGRFAVSFRNLKSSEAWDYNASQPFVAASSIKLGINTYLYTQIESGKIDPAEILSYDNRSYPTGDYESGTGTIQYEANGTKYTVRDTSGLSIRISDNCGTNMIIRRLGGIDTVNVYLKSISNVVDYRKSVSYTNYAGNAQSGRHRTSSADLAAHAVRLYTLWQANPAVYGSLIDDLSHTEFTFGIQKGLPATVQVAHKIGTNGTYSAENDVGIVMAKEPFVLCVMTEMASASAAHQIQADVARILYNYIQDLR